MGWPRKDEKMRLYYEIKSKTYLLVFINPDYPNKYDYIGELLSDNNPNQPMLAKGTTSPFYLITYGKGTNVRRVSWDELPDVWRKAFMDYYFNKEPKENPKDMPGLWRSEDKQKEKPKRWHNWTKKTLPRCAMIHMEQLQYAHFNYRGKERQKDIKHLIENYSKIENDILQRKQNKKTTKPKEKQS